MLCRRINVFLDVVIATDGSKFKVVNSRDRNYTAAKIKKLLEHITESINPYLAAFETADWEGDP